MAKAAQDGAQPRFAASAYTFNERHERAGASGGRRNPFGLNI